MTKTSDTWHQTFAAMFSKHLTAAEIQTYQNEILAAFEGKTRPWIGEAADAIRSLADKWPKASAGQNAIDRALLHDDQPGAAPERRRKLGDTPICRDFAGLAGTAQAGDRGGPLDDHLRAGQG